MGDRAQQTALLRKFIRKAHPKAKTLLELGCGSGSVLQHLVKEYEVTGLDLSPEMLAIARTKVPKAKLYRQDMVSFRLKQRFDGIFCIFDSINHVLSFAAWKKIFANAHRHLAESGVFIFDINTLAVLNKHIAKPPWVYKFGNNLLIITVTRIPRASNWNVRVFERIKGNRYVLHEEDIREASFPAPKIVSALKAYFRSVQIVDVVSGRPSAESDRLYFICGK